MHHTATLRTSQMFKCMLSYIFNVHELKQTLFSSKFLLSRNKTFIIRNMNTNFISTSRFCFIN